MEEQRSSQRLEEGGHTQAGRSTVETQLASDDLTIFLNETFLLLIDMGKKKKECCIKVFITDECFDQRQH